MVLKNHILFFEIFFAIATCRLRILAESKGYVLDDTGLYLATQSSGGKRVRTYTLVHITQYSDILFSGPPILIYHEICRRGDQKLLLTVTRRRMCLTHLDSPGWNPMNEISSLS
jgi:hypothetical protein